LMKDALYQIGMGCQILDDMVDLSMDIRTDRHNYVASLIYFGSNAKERARLATRPVGDEIGNDKPDFLFEFPEARQVAAKKALQFLRKGTKSLFIKEHIFMIDYSIKFFARQIGAEKFLDIF
jgi:hypothetical protein